jgi:hypothetical protein
VQHLGLDQVQQRRAAGGEQGVEGVAGALEGGEAEADRRPEHDPVARGVAVKIRWAVTTRSAWP